ncbi:MAG: phenylalanine--tRNA ligase subunit beta [bacterium]
MKVSYNWLSCFTDVPGLEELADILINLGFEVASVEGVKDDTIIDLEIPVSRHDALSIIGLARDISAFTKRPLIPLEIPVLEENLALIPEITIEEPLLCPRYTGRIISNIKVCESPPWLKERLINCGIRPINNIVDITNYVLLELGHPMHSFDYDKLEGGIFVRQGKKGEKLLCLDEREYDVEGAVVIADSKKPIAIGGIIGGEETSVSNETKTVLLEVAYFSPIAIRRVSKKLGIITESSYRFERMVDPDGLIKAQNRAASLIFSLIPEAKIGPISDIYPNPCPALKIKLREKRVNKVLGTSLKGEEMKDILERLGFGIEDDMVMVPSFRGEITREIDLIEEIARIYQYGRIKETMPISPIIPHINKNFIMTRKIREIMLGCGMDEVIAYSFTSNECLERLKIPLGNIVSLASPLSTETSIMTPSLIPGLLEIAKTNISRDQENLSIFQIGKVFEKQREWTSLSGIMTGTKGLNWMDKKRDFTFFDILGVIKRLFLELGIDCNFKTSNIPFTKQGLNIVYNDKICGIAGVLLPEIGEYYGCKKPLFLFELNLGIIISSHKKKVFKEFSKYPKIEIDICLLVPEGIKSENVEEIIKKEGKSLVKDVFLYDIYKGGNIPANHKSITYRITYQADDKTLTMDEIEKIRDNTLKVLQKGLSISLRTG